MQRGHQAIVKAVMQEILILVGESLWVRLPDYHHGFMYVKHVLLHGLLFHLMDFVHGPNHSIHLTHLPEHSIHVLQQFREGEVLPTFQGVYPMPWVAPQTHVDVGLHTLFGILLQPTLDIESPYRICDISTEVCRLKYG